MRPRASPLDLTAGPHYVAVRLDTREQPVYLRRLLPRRSAELVRWGHELEAEAQRDVAAIEADPARGQWHALETGHEYLASIQGRYLGLMLAWPDVELSTDATQHPTPESYGAAVVEELWEAGYSIEEIQALFSAALQVCIRMATQSGVNGQEVRRYLDFGEARGETITRSSPPGSATTAIPTPS